MKRIHLFFPAVVILLIAVMAVGCGDVNTELPPPTTTPPTTGGTPTTIQVTLASSAIASGGSTMVTATVTDALSAPVSGVTVTFTVISATAGTFSPVSGTTDASGVVTTTFNAAAVDAAATIVATAGTVTGTRTISIGTPPRVPSTVVVSLGSSTIANAGSTTVSATVRDTLGVISGVTVTFSVSVPGAVTFTPATAVTNASGVATSTVTAVSTDTVVNINATAGSVSNSASLTIGSPPPPVATTLNLNASPAQIPVSDQSTISVSLLAAGGAPAYNTPVTISITNGATLGSLSSTATVTSISTVTDSSGNASAIFYAGVSSGFVTITATSGSLTKSVSIAISSDPASVTLTLGAPALLNGQNTTIEATVVNSAGAAVDLGTPVTFALTYSGSAPGSLSSDTAYTNGSGIAQVTFTADAVVTGQVLITATAGGITTSPQLLQVNPAGVGSLLFISAEPQIIGLAGSGTADTSVVTFQVLNSLGGAMANQSVNFSIAIGPIGATITASGSTGADGTVSAILRSGTVAGPVRVVATTEADPGPPPVILSASSGNISIGGGVPSDKWMSVSATKLNIDGAGCDGVETVINARLADRFGNYNILEGTSVSFATEGGAIDASNITNASGVASVIFRSQDPRPADGRVSVLVMTTGEEDFFDENANGVFDGTDTFTDLAEPFIDADESTNRGAGELFFDWPLSVPTSVNGIYNSANGLWDGQIPIYRNIVILLSGRPVSGPAFSRIETITGGTGVVDIGNGGSQVFRIYVGDALGNAPIAGTTINIKASKGTLSTTSVTIPDGNYVGPYYVDVRLTSPSCASPPCTPETATLDADISWNGTCQGQVKVPIFYPGTINFTYL